MWLPWLPLGQCGLLHARLFHLKSTSSKFINILSISLMKIILTCTTCAFMYAIKFISMVHITFFSLFLVYANQGEPGSISAEGSPFPQLHSSATVNLPSAVTSTPSRITNPLESTKAKLAAKSAFSSPASLVQTSNILKSRAVTTVLVHDESLTTGDISNTEQTPSLFQTQAIITSSPHAGISGDRDIFSVTQTSNLMQTQTVSTSTLQESLTTPSGTLIAVQTPNFSESQASTTGVVPGSISITSGQGTSSLMQSPNVMQSQVGSTGLAGTPVVIVTPSAMQTHLKQSQVQSSSIVLTSISEGVTSTSLPPATAVMSASHSLSTSVPTYTATRSYVDRSSISEYGTLLSSSEVLPSGVVPTSQSVFVQVTPSGQVSLFTSVMKGESSSLHMSANRSLDVVAMSTKGSLSSSTPAKPLPSASPVVSYSTQPSVIPSSQNVSSQVMAPTQVSVFTSVIKGESSSLYLSANQSLKVVVMSTKAPVSSSPPAKPLQSTSSVVAYSVPPNITSSGQIIKFLFFVILVYTYSCSTCI